jgi:VCBS repeat-containing protein
VDEGDTLSVNAVEGETGNVGTELELASGALLTLNADGSYTYDPNNQFESLAGGETATDSFAYTLSDGNQGTATATVEITLDGINDAPEVENAIDDIQVDEDSNIAPINLFNVFEDAEDADADLNYTVTNNSNQNLVATAIDQGNGELSLTLNENANGSADLTVQVEDNNGATVEENFTLTVNPVNDAPTLENQSFRVDENSDVGTEVGIVEVNEPEGNPLIFNFDEDNLPTDVDEDGELPFTINNSGEIAVNDSDDLDFETQESFTFGVVATEDSEDELTGTANVTINLNDLDELPSDLNDDNLVNLDDLGIFASAFLSETGDENFNPNADINGDSLVNLNDLGILASDFSEGEAIA